MAFLRVEPEVISNIRQCVGNIWRGALLRVSLGLCLIFGLKWGVGGQLGNSIGWAAGTFLLLPPAMTAPTLSLMWGGNYFLSVQSTVLLSVISPAILFFVSRNGVNVSVAPFLTMFFLAGLIPAFAAQLQRKNNPIRTGALSTNWGWLGGASLIPLALLTGYGFMPTIAGLETSKWFNMILKDGIFSFLLFAVIYILGLIAARMSKGGESAKRDVFITHTVPNLFFWASLLPAMERNGLIPLFSAVLFFFSIWMQEKVHIQRFSSAIQNTRKPSFTKTSVRGVLAIQSNQAKQTG
jgi:hypothetical protein